MQHYQCERALALFLLNGCVDHSEDIHAEPFFRFHGWVDVGQACVLPHLGLVVLVQRGTCLGGMSLVLLVRAVNTLGKFPHRA